MSLINEALKKAERMRRDQGDQPAELNQASQGTPRRKGSSMLLIGAIAVGATALVCVSVFITLRLARNPVGSIAVPATQRAIENGDTPSVVSAKPVPAKMPVLLDATPADILPQGQTKGPASPHITLPISAVPADRAAPPAAARTKPTGETSPETVPPTSAEPAPAPATPTISLVAITDPGPIQGIAGPAQGSPAVQAFVNNLKIMGIRASGNQSRVLMNDRVYRVNDIVDRSLGLRLVEVSNDRLVFVDATGARYFRNF